MVTKDYKNSIRSFTKTEVPDYSLSDFYKSVTIEINLPNVLFMRCVVEQLYFNVHLSGAQIPFFLFAYLKGK